MKKIYFYISLVCTLFSCGCSEKKSVSVWDLVPPDAAVVLEAHSSTDLLSTMSFLSDFELPDGFISDWKQADSVFCLNPKIRGCLETSPVSLVLSPIDGNLESVSVYCFDNRLSISDFVSVIESNGLLYSIRTVDKIEYLQVALPDTVFAVVHQNHLAVSSSDSLILALINQWNNPEKIFHDTDFQLVENTLGSTIPVHLYLNYSVLNSQLINNISSNYVELARYFENRFQGIAALDVLLNPEALVVNGYSVSTDSMSSLRPLKYQLPVPNSVVNVLPFNTRMMLHLGMSDYESYWEEFAENEKIDNWNKKLKTNLAEKFVALFSEVSVCAIGTAAKPVFVGRLSDPAGIKQFMEGFESKCGVVENIVNQGYTVKKLNAKNFVPDVFGSYFCELSAFCYSVVDQYLVIANDIQEVQDVISCYRSGRTLDLSENFKAFQNNMLESANVTFYLALAENQRFIQRYLSGDWAAFLKDNQSFLQGYQALSFQFSSAKDLVYTCFNMRKSTGVKEESNVQWKVNLEASLSGKPYIVADPASDYCQVVVFDINNTMYLIDYLGNVKWKKRFEEAPMSDLFVVDYDKNGQGQFLFNSADYLQLIDNEGNSVDGFPKRLLCEASNGLSVFDYDESRDYRVMICGTDKFVYNYDLHGGETEGWNRHRTDEVVTQPVQHLVADNKDMIIVTDSKGTARILDRQGRIRIPLKSDFRKSQHAGFYENKTNRKGVILTSDDVGNLLYVANDGGLARTEFGQFSAQHFFLYEDFNGDGDPDFIYLDGNKLQVFNRFKKVLYSHDFDTEIKTRPVFYRLSRSKRLLGVVSGKSREIYLIDKNGSMIVNSGLVGETDFAIGSMKGNHEINLLTGVGNTLFNYLIY